MIMLTKSSLGIAAASAGLCFVGYCVYFDRKRRSDPSFQEKLREKRKKQPKSADKSSAMNIALPDLNNPEACQKFFLQEAQLGEELLAHGDVEGGVEHLTYAVAVCGNPQQLLQMLQQSLPPQVFQLMIQNLPTVTQRLSSKMTQMPILSEDDVE